MTTPAAFPLRAILAPLFVVQFLSWSGMFCLWIYAVPVITQFVYGAPGDGASYRAGLFAVSGCFALYALLAACLAFALPRAIGRFGAGSVHGCALLTGAMGLASLGLVTRPVLLIPAFAAIGVGWSSLSNIPYAIAGAAAPEGRGAHILRIFGFSTVAPQIAMTLGLAAASRIWFGDAVNRVMIAGGAMMALAGVVTLLLRDRFNVPQDDW
jgi:maltose/moltooligosaccharide transporter